MYIRYYAALLKHQPLVVGVLAVSSARGLIQGLSEHPLAVQVFSIFLGIWAFGVNQRQLSSRASLREDKLRLASVIAVAEGYSQRVLELFPQMMGEDRKIKTESAANGLHVDANTVNRLRNLMGKNVRASDLKFREDTLFLEISSNDKRIRQIASDLFLAVRSIETAFSMAGIQEEKHISITADAINCLQKAYAARDLACFIFQK